MSYTIRCRNGQRWKVREAVSLKAACSEIAFARATGSIGGKSTKTEYGRDLKPGPTIVLADVVRLNSDNTEAQPYQAAY